VPKICFAPGPCQTSECDPLTGICIVTSIPDSDGDGICDPDDNCPNIPGVIGSSCSSGDACYVNEVIDENCNCVGEPRICDDGDPCTEDSCHPVFGCISLPITIDADGDGICDAGDTCPNLFGQIGSPCDDANPYTVNDLIDANCSCTGFALDSDGDGLTDQDEVEIYFTDPFEDDTDSDGLSDWAEVFESLTSPILADTDGDGCSDLLEYAKLCPDSPPCGEPACVGDVNSDGVINTGDLNTLLSSVRSDLSIA
jgi:hypothetical protein